mmetsp:Transcript_90625/g.282198  ORF Transcript_90625/g.282198 Transcript_90625/m.282198 type:complete len:270 (+) Transcript_90625:1621-2430(+)
MTLSAPLVKTTYSPLYSHTTVIRFRSDVKGAVQSTVSSWLPCGASICKQAAEALPEAAFREYRVMPTSCAASRKATSSGELPEKMGAPALLHSTCASWQTVRQRKNLRHSWHNGSLSSWITRLTSSMPGAGPSSEGTGSLSKGRLEPLDMFKRVVSVSAAAALPAVVWTTVPPFPLEGWLWLLLPRDLRAATSDRNSPKSLPPTKQRAKRISFCVRVPVLSEKTCRTWPISSTRSAVRAIADLPDCGSTICLSMLIWKPSMSFMISKQT